MSDIQGRPTAQQAETLRQMGRYSAAIDQFTAVLKDRPHDWWSLAHRGASKASLGDHDGAINDLDEAITLRKGAYPWALAQKGEAFRLALRDSITWTDADRLRALVESGEHWFDEAIEQSPDYEWALAHRAALCATAFMIWKVFNLPDGEKGVWFKKANEGFKKAIALNPSYAWAMLFRGLLLALAGEFDKARGLAGQAFLATDGNNMHQHRAMTELFYYGKRFDEALVQGALARRADPEDRLTLYFIAMSLKAKGDPNAKAAIAFARNQLRSLQNLTTFMIGTLDSADGDNDASLERIAPLLGSLDVELAFISHSDPFWQPGLRSGGDPKDGRQEVLKAVEALRSGKTSLEDV